MTCSACSQDGGVVMVTFVPAFISEEVRTWNRRRTRRKRA